MAGATQENRRGRWSGTAAIGTLRHAPYAISMQLSHMRPFRPDLPVTVFGSYEQIVDGRCGRAVSELRTTNKRHNTSTIASKKRQNISATTLSTSLPACTGEPSLYAAFWLASPVKSSAIRKVERRQILITEARQW